MNAYSEYDKRVRQLRNHPLVVAWIEDYYRGHDWLTNPGDCGKCGWPHNPFLICGGGSTFGSLRIGDDRYFVDWSNVEVFVNFRSQSHEGWFHWSRDRFFRKTSDGIEVLFYAQYNNTPQERIWKIPQNEWKSIVDQCGGAP